MADVVYNSAKRDSFNGAIDYNTDTFKAMLVSGYTPNKDSHSKRSDITGEISGTGYISGGKALTGVTFTQDNTDNEGVVDCDDIVWTGATFSAQGCVIYKSRGGASSADELVKYIDFGGTITATGGDFKITIAAEGLINFNSSDFVFNSAKKELFDGTIDLDTDDIGIMLVNGYTPNIDSHSKRSDVTGEVSGPGYTAGGVSLTGKSVTQDNTDDEGVFDADDVSWPSSSIAADGAVLYKKRGGLASADELIMYIPFGSVITSTNSNFNIVWGAEGILNLNDL